MGWLSRSVTGPPDNGVATSTDRDCVAYGFAPLSMGDDHLPWIPPAVVWESAMTPRCWIVIDSIVYDCTDFLASHPGGPDTIGGFRGTECTWQFWRFHGTDVLVSHGRALRIGRTQGVANRFVERPRFVGLRTLDVDD